MESVAVLSDIHGVLPALDAVLAEPAVLAAERIAVTGDIAAGPQPGEVLDRLIGLGDRVTWVRGNADRELVELARGETDDVGDPIAHWAARQLAADHVDLLASLPPTVLLEVVGFRPVMFCHATPRDDAEVVVVDSRLERWTEVLAGLPDEVMTVVCGHTHMPFARLANRRQIVNPGSVGMPYGRAGAHWALLTAGTVEMRARLRRARRSHPLLPRPPRCGLIFGVSGAGGRRMDPITLIVTALAAGAASALQDDAKEAVRTAYARLRDGLKKRFAGRAVGEMALARHEAAPQTWEQPLRAELVATDAGDDADLVGASQTLMKLLDEAGSRSGKYNVMIHGGQGIQIGDHNTQTNTFGADPACLE